MLGVRGQLRAVPIEHTMLHVMQPPLPTAVFTAHKFDAVDRHRPHRLQMILNLTSI